MTCLTPFRTILKPRLGTLFQVSFDLDSQPPVCTSSSASSLQAGRDQRLPGMTGGQRAGIANVTAWSSPRPLCAHPCARVIDQGRVNMGACSLEMLIGREGEGGASAQGQMRTGAGARADDKPSGAHWFSFSQLYLCPKKRGGVLVIEGAPRAILTWVVVFSTSEWSPQGRPRSGYSSCRSLPFPAPCLPKEPKTPWASRRMTWAPSSFTLPAHCVC